MPARRRSAVAECSREEERATSLALVAGLGRIGAKAEAVPSTGPGVGEASKESQDLSGLQDDECCPGAGVAEELERDKEK